MNELEPLCNFEQSKMLKELGMNEATSRYFNQRNETCLSDECHYNEWNNKPLISRPTISLAKNWVFREYGIWIESQKIQKGIYTQYYFRCRIDELIISNVLETVDVSYENIQYQLNCKESECLTEILKHLKNKSHD